MIINMVMIINKITGEKDLMLLGYFALEHSENFNLILLKIDFADSIDSNGCRNQTQENVKIKITDFRKFAHCDSFCQNRSQIGFIHSIYNTDITNKNVKLEFN